MRRKAILLVLTMAATLMVASGVAFAVNKVCSSGTTQANPCLGTNKTKTASGNDTLIGTSGPDYIKALSGNDKISGGAGDDTTDGGSGNDTYSYKDNWGTDTLVDASGVDTLNFSAVEDSINASLFPDYSPDPKNEVSRLNGGGRVDASVSPLSVIEKVVGSASNYDFITTGGRPTPSNPVRERAVPYSPTSAAAPLLPAALPQVASPQATTLTRASLPAGTEVFTFSTVWARRTN